MTVYKLKVLVSRDDESEGLKYFYFDVETISGFYIPDFDEDDQRQGINILHDGDQTSILQEPHIVKYLTEKFVNKAITK